MTNADRIVELLTRAGKKVTFAESCTGGLITAGLVSASGASGVLDESYVTYANEAKQKLLGVKAQTLELHGAVSEECAREMAAGARKAAGADYAAVSTGIAGPGGGSAEKPVGLVYLGIAGPNGITVEKNIFPGDRQAVRTAAADRALQMLLNCLLRDTAR